MLFKFDGTYLLNLLFVVDHLRNHFFIKENFFIKDYLIV